ncbi:MAG: N-acetylmuramidase family protein [Myxococcota bacterium]|jgi:hypothetical protein
MKIADLQTVIGTTPDGRWGPASRAALLAHFSNTNAPAITPPDIVTFAERLGCTVKQVRAVAKVESGAGGFDDLGRPRILFERHYFHRLTEGRWTPATYSNPKGGGYSENSWEKLSQACGRDPDAAFQSASWGRFQVMGAHWRKLGFASPYEFAHSFVQSEANHYWSLVHYIEAFGLVDEMRAISTDPDDCRGFAKGYNGPQYQRFDYHEKLAAAMR